MRSATDERDASLLEPSHPTFRCDPQGAGHDCDHLRPGTKALELPEFCPPHLCRVVAGERISLRRFE
jgi:hypothetical protein